MGGQKENVSCEIVLWSCVLPSGKQKRDFFFKSLPVCWKNKWCHKNSDIKREQDLRKQPYAYMVGENPRCIRLKEKYIQPEVTYVSSPLNVKPAMKNGKEHEVSRKHIIEGG